jgi:HD superfamily phosphohydrolase
MAKQPKHAPVRGKPEQPNAKRWQISSSKPQRVRDPLHNLIEFNTEQIEEVIWRVIQTRPFQRLRRIKQLGFSELVYPGATHSRFAHSIGVFHTARHLMEIIERHIRSSGHHHFRDHQAHVALAAALVHDVGHGMFSHAFEYVGKKLKLTMAQHENVSDFLIRESEISHVFQEMGSGFANDVATVVKRRGPGNLYDAVVSSQFDADRLDYMQRDRLMTGLQSGGIDFTWLMANLEIGRIKTGVDEISVGDVETFVLGPKAFYAAETYVLALFQLYPTIYFHKATRAAEKLFSGLFLRIISLVRAGLSSKTGLPKLHPLIRFASKPESLENVLALDDAVFWGALPMLTAAKDAAIRESAIRLRDRRLPKCIEIRQRLVSEIGLSKATDPKEREDLKKRLDVLMVSIETRLDSWSAKHSTGSAKILTDRAVRNPYNRFEESKGPLNQIHIRMNNDNILDVASCSSVIGAIESFELFRAYADDEDAKSVVEKILKEELGRN